MDNVRALRARGLDTPNVDPDDGGVNARMLILLETAGPKAVGTGFISCDNPDPSARNLTKVLAAARLARSEIVIWNVVPQFISTADKNKNVTAAQIREAAPDLQAFVDALPYLEVVMFCGRSAQRSRVLFPPRVKVLRTFHPGAMAYNRARLRAHLHATAAEAKSLL